MNNKEEIPIVYLFYHLRFRTWLKRNKSNYQVISPELAYEILRRTNKIPKDVIHTILKEMERHGLIKWLNHKNYEILPSKDKRIKGLEQDYPLWT